MDIPPNGVKLIKMQPQICSSIFFDIKYSCILVFGFMYFKNGCRFHSWNVGICFLCLARRMLWSHCFPWGPLQHRAPSLKSPERDLERVETTWKGHYQLLSIAFILLCIILNSQACLLPRLSHYSLPLYLQFFTNLSNSSCFLSLYLTTKPVF